MKFKLYWRKPSKPPTLEGLESMDNGRTKKSGYVLDHATITVDGKEHTLRGLTTLEANTVRDFTCNAYGQTVSLTMECEYEDEIL